MFQVRERGVAGAEVVDREPDADRPQAAQQPHSLLRIPDHHAFGHLELDPAAGHVRFLEHAHDVLEQAGAHELPGRQVDRHPESRQALLGPLLRLQTRGPQRPFSDRNDRAGLLCERHELIGRDGADGRVLPPQQAFDPVMRPVRAWTLGW